MAYYDNIKLEKGMYGTERSFTEVLEQLDPSENYRNTELEGLDAYQRQLKRFDIKVSGEKSDPVQKFFQTSDSAALFPEYVSRAVRRGMEKENILGDILAAKTVIDGLDYRSVVSDPTVEDKKLSPVAEGAFLPQTTIRTSDRLVKLNKRGRMLVASYEAVKFQKLDLFTVTLRQIGSYIAAQLISDAVGVLADGADNISKTGANLAYTDLLSLWTVLSPYEFNTILAPTNGMTRILGMTQMQDSKAGQTFHADGTMITPLGAKLFHVPSAAPSKLIALDKNCALEMVQSGDIVTDHDKLIDRQLERAGISITAGFTKLFPSAVKTLTY